MLDTFVIFWRFFPSKWLQNRPQIPKPSPGIPPRRAFCGGPHQLRTLSRYSGRACVKPLRSSYTGLHPQSWGGGARHTHARTHTLSLTHTRTHTLCLSHTLSPHSTHTVGGGRETAALSCLCIYVASPDTTRCAPPPPHSAQISGAQFL